MKTDCIYELVEWQRKEIKLRWNIAKTILGGYCSADKIPKPFIWLSLPEPWRTPDFVAALKTENVNCIDSNYFVNGPLLLDNNVISVQVSYISLK